MPWLDGIGVTRALTGPGVPNLLQVVVVTTAPEMRDLVRSLGLDPP